MVKKLRTRTGKTVYARREVIPERVFGYMKPWQGAGPLLLRGHEAPRGDCTLHATAQNLRKLAAHADKFTAHP